MRCTFFKAAFLLSLALYPFWVMSQAWPNKPVKLIVPFPPGGMADVVSRILGQHLSETWGQQVVVENRAGAGGTIATSAVVKAAPDGYTLMAVFDTHAAAPYLYKINYDLLQDLTPISMVARSPMLLVANANFPAKTLPSLLQYAKDKPSAINFVTVGPGSPARLMLELLKNSTGINVTVVPYKGGGPAMVDLISGQVDAMIASVPTVAPHVKSGRLRVLAVTSEKRSSLVPGVPAMSETIPGFGTEAWVGIMGPAKMPPEVVAQINTDVAKALNSAEIKNKFIENGLEPSYSNPEEFERWIRREMARWSKVIREQNVTLD
jgi:tripartite-type tricarboxylate transporter receptor subunit TctC